MQRRLAAILAADVVGYSRLMASDEAGTYARLKALRKDFIEPAIEQHHGHIVKLMGDGLLVEFASVVDAVTCAAAIQKGLAKREAETPEDQRIALRIGINIGDIILDDDDIYGDGVNVAARLEPLAEPGGICVSSNVYNQVKNKLALGFEPAGKHSVKNIPEPVTVYRVILEPGAVAKAVGLKRTGPLRWRLAGAGLVIVIAVIGIAIWQQPWRSDEQAPAQADLALPLPDKPSIAVLPFDNLSGDAEQDYFADGMTEDLITDLSKISDLFVIARNSSFAYKGRQVDLRQVGKELGVRYVLEGSVRRAGKQVRINTQLVDATTGGHVWAERYDRKLDNIFAVQDEIMGKVVQALELHLTDRDRTSRDQGSQTSSLEAYDLVLKARKLLSRFDYKAATQAGELLQRAIELDPAYTEAHSLLGFYYFDEWRVWGRKRDQNLERALEFGKTAVELSPSDPAPHVLLALVYQWRRDFAAANAEADRALDLQPNDAITLSNLGSMLNWAGRSEEALGLLQRAIRLDPFHPPSYLERLAFAHSGVGDYEQCVEAANRGIALDPDYVGLYVTQTVCYVALGKDEEARASAAEIIRTNPRFTLKAYASYAPYTDERVLQREVEMLREVGVPGSPEDIFIRPEGHMTGEQIRMTISGQTFVDTRPARFAGTVMTFDPSGALTGHPQSGSPAEQFGRDEGRWWVEGDKFCRQWTRWVSGQAGCFSLVQKGDSIRWINRYGEFSSEMKKLSES